MRPACEFARRLQHAEDLDFLDLDFLILEFVSFRDLDILTFMPCLAAGVYRLASLGERLLCPDCLES